MSGEFFVICNNILKSIGRTPLVKINKLSSPGDATVLGKLEFFNPAGSVKERIGLSKMQDAKEKRICKPSGQDSEVKSIVY